MPQFVILRHDAPQGVHFDFMLEVGGILKTWALHDPPRPAADIPGDALPDHRLAYLDYEGPVSGSRGSVERWDRGHYTVERQDDAEWIVQLAGTRLSGRAILRRCADAASLWRFTWDGPQRGPSRGA
jgi:hypothetical protein